MKRFLFKKQNNMNKKRLMKNQNYSKNIFDCNYKIEKSRIKPSIQTMIRFFLFIF